MYKPKLRMKKNGLPIMRNSEIDTHAEEFLKDYNPSVLLNPQPINMEEFAEFYLNLTLDFTYLSQCGFILGRMIFQEKERVPVYLPEEKCADYLYADRGTLLIDNTLLDEWKEYRLRSTIGHECGHWLFHSDYYTNTRCKYHQEDKVESEITGCKKADIEVGTEMPEKKRFVTDMDWLEHHAKYFSAAILMPKTPFMNVVSELRENRFQNNTVLAEVLSDIFQVSPWSANIRLVQLGLMESTAKKKHTYDEKRLQLFSQIPSTL